MNSRESMAKEIAANQKCIVANHNLNSVALLHREPKFREFYEISKYTHRRHAHRGAGPLVWISRSPRSARNLRGLDWPLMETAAAKGWRIFYVGSKPGIAASGAAKLKERYPALNIQTRDGYFDAEPSSAENQAILQAIADHQPDLLMVGMGMPRQELWILNNFPYLHARVILPSGAAIDYVAGAVKTPPRWMGRWGLEWAYRLATEPKRLWRRYLVEPWSILGVAVRHFFRKR